MRRRCWCTASLQVCRLVVSSEALANLPERQHAAAHVAASSAHARQPARKSGQAVMPGGPLTLGHALARVLQGLAVADEQAGAAEAACGGHAALAQRLACGVGVANSLSACCWEPCRHGVFVFVCARALSRRGVCGRHSKPGGHQCTRTRVGQALCGALPFTMEPVERSMQCSRLC